MNLKNITLLILASAFFGILLAIHYEISNLWLRALIVAPAPIPLMFWVNHMRKLKLNRKNSNNLS